MAIGPLEQFVFPGTYTRTFVESPTPSAAGGVRFAALIGPGLEEEKVEAFEMVRGSSATADNIILGEIALTNGRGNVVDGNNIEFYTRHYPLTINDGRGSYATKPSDVIVQVNGENAAVQAVDATNGKITLVEPPSLGDLVVLNYYFKRRDQYVEFEDVSAQVDGTTRSFKVKSRRIVKGDNGGNAATSSDINVQTQTEIDGTLVSVPVIYVQVNGTEVSIESLSGSNGVFTLTAAPLSGEQVLVSYFKNDFQNTFDILPAAQVLDIARVGYDPGRVDFLKNRDYVLAHGNEIHWGSSVVVETGESTVGTTPLGENQISATMVDNRLYKVEVPAVAGSTKVYALPFVPVRGDGSGRPKYDPQNGTPGDINDDILAFVGPTLDDALLNPVEVVKVEGQNITLQTAVAPGDIVFVDFFANFLVDEEWTVSNVLPGTTNVGKYTVQGLAYGSARQVVLDVGISTSTATFLDTGTMVWDGVAGSSNAYIAPSRLYGNEVITVTVDAAGAFVVTSSNPMGTGSGAVNTGVVGQTYKDAITGFTFALATATAGTLVFNVTKEFTVLSQPELGVPGLSFNVSDTTGVSIGDTAVISSFNLNFDDEPAVGSAYYVTFTKAKVDFSPKYLTSFPDVQRVFGPLAQNNPIVMGADLYFKNGGQAIVMKQVPKAPGSNEPTVSSYTDAIAIFEEPLTNGARPSLIQVLTANPVVLGYLKTANAIQTSERMQNERTSYFGFNVGTTPEMAMNFAKGVQSELMTGIYPDSAVITVPDSNGNDQDIQVSGPFIACAMAGADVSPAVDIATPLTNTQLVGFRRLGRNLNKAVAGQVAQSGLTVLEGLAGVITVLMPLTTDLSSVLTRDPRIVEVKHFAQQAIRRVTKPFIGRKNLGGLTNEIKTSVTGLFSSLVRLRLIGEFRNVVVEQDTVDPTIVYVSVYYRPVFGVNWIMATHYLRSTL